MARDTATLEAPQTQGAQLKAPDLALRVMRPKKGATWGELIRLRECAQLEVDRLSEIETAASAAHKALEAGADWPEPPAALTVTNAPILLVIDGVEKVIGPTDYTFKDSTDIIKRFDGDLEAAKPMLTALAEWEAVKEVYEQASGIADAAELQILAQGAFEEAVDIHYAAEMALLKTPTLDPIKLAFKRAIVAKTHWDPDMSEALADSMIEAATALDPDPMTPALWIEWFLAQGGSFHFHPPGSDELWMGQPVRRGDEALQALNDQLVGDFKLRVMELARSMTSASEPESYVSIKAINRAREVTA